ncbi:non-ribosomal peptide synthetase/type I polyketide synthase [Vibrio mimicus]|uniref:non-ribosomal peptide synthetase/type I polyketide synthase n=1 Tax=Vibrio mimicus TaxID=674 RepID=UPI002FF0FFE3
MNNLDNSFGNSDPIAVIGLACRFPKAPNAEVFWHNLIHGISGQSYFTQEELSAAGISDQISQQDNFVPSGAIIENPEFFDAGLFGYSPTEALSIDPQQRLFLQNVWHALEDAGYSPTSIKAKTGVFGSIRASTYPSFADFDVTQVGQVKGLQALVGNDKDYLATRVAHKFNFTGPAFTVQTACSSSLVATHLACESLRSGECDMAIAGGVAVSFPQASGYQYQSGMIFSPDGVCRPFDVNANGTFGGHGLGCVVLKRLDDAIQDGDTILAILRGSAINNDGQNKVGFTAPSVSGQSQVLTDALHLADVNPDDVEMIETHGTGTKLGDPIEITAIKHAYSRSSQGNPCFLGSVKSGLGHLDTAAGIASLIKTILSVSRGKIPASLNISQPNPALGLEDSSFKLATETMDWQSNIRTAGVSSFGIGGTNCHMIVQSAPDFTEPSTPIVSPEITKLLISANSETSLRQLAAQYAMRLEQHGDWGDIAYSAISSRSLDLPYRLAVDCDLSTIEHLRHYAESGQTAPCLQVGQRAEKNKIVWCFTGQGSQWAGMGHELYQTSSAFRQSIELSQRYALDVTKTPLTEYLFGEKTDLLKRTDYTQLAIVAFEIAMAAHWQAKGFEPDIVMGHSVGEFAACVVAGYLSHQHAILLVAERGRLMHQCAQTQAGAMLAVFAEQSVLDSRLTLHSLDLAAHNGDQHWVYSGQISDIDQAIQELEGRNIHYKKLDVPCAAHSRLLDDMLPSFTEFAASIPVSEGTITLISSLTGKPIAHASSLNAHYWARHVREPVQFHQSVESALVQKANIFMEMGPAAHLSSIGRREVWSPPALWLHTCQSSLSSQRAEAEALATLFVAGIDKAWPTLFKLQGRRCALPLYAFDEQQYWYQPSTMQQAEHSQILLSTEVEKPASIQAIYEMLRCCVIRDLLRACSDQPRFTLRDIIRGGRLLPRYRDLVAALLDRVIEHGYVQKRGKTFKYSATPLPATELVAQWLRDALLANQEPTSLQLTDLRVLCDAAPRIQDLLSRYNPLPEHATNHFEEIELLLRTQSVTAQQLNTKCAVSNDSHLLYLDWPHQATEQSWEAVIAQQIPRFVHENRSDWQLSVTHAFSQNAITQLVVHRAAQMWGEVKYSLRGQLTSGQWAWVGDVKTPNFNELSELMPLPSPHNRYQWQWQLTEPCQQMLPVSQSDIECAFSTKGELYRVNSAFSLLVLPDGPLADSAAQVANALVGDFETLYVLTSKGIPAQNNDTVEPEKFALMSLVRVARTERKHQQIYLLDINEHDTRVIADALKYAPFHQSFDIAYRNQGYWFPQLVHAEPVKDTIPSSWFTASGWHIVTGGTGGIGRILIQWLAKSGVRNIAVIGRRKPTDWVEFCQTMSRQGCHITTLLCDLSVDGELEQTLNGWQHDLPIIGAFHAAGIPAHGLLAQWEAQETKALIQVKANSFTSLHRWLESQKAQYLVGFSSVASLGALGQGAYAIANAYLDGYALAHQGKSGCRVVSIAWGAWDKVGMTSEQTLLDKLAKEGMHTISPEEGIWQVSQSLLSGSPVTLAMNIEPQHANFCRYFKPLDISNTQSSLVEPTDLIPKQPITDLLAWMTERIRYQLGISENTTISATQDLLQLGLDSLQFLELSACLQKQFAIKINPEEAYRDMSVAGLVAMIEQKRNEERQDTTVEPFIIDQENRYSPFPLTPIQHAYWIGREPWVQYGGIACHVVFEWDKNLTEFDQQKFEAAWNALIQRHDMLRMTITASGEQVVHAHVPHFAITETDLRSLTQEAQNDALEQIRYRMRHQVRPADVWPLFDVSLSRLSEQKVRLHLNLDLLQFDVQSFKIMMDDLAAAYQGKTLSHLPITFRDYVIHEQKLRRLPDWQTSWNYWQQTIPNLPKAPMLPLNPDYNHREPVFITLEGRLNRVQWQTLKAQWQQWSVTPSAGLLTLFAHTLAKWAHSPNFTLNMTFFNRQPFHEAVQHLIGDFTSVLLMDFQHEQDASLKQRMLATQNTLWQRLGHSQVNGVEVIRELAKHWKTSGKLSEQEATLPLTPVVFTSMLGMSMDGMDIEQAMTHLLGDPVYVLSQTPQVWLDHQIMEVDGDLAFNWYCMDGVLEPKLVENMFESYLDLMQQCAQTPELLEYALPTSKHNEIPIFTGATQEQRIDWPSIPIPEISPDIAQEVTQAWTHLEYQALHGIWATLQHHQLFTSPEQSYSAVQIIQQLNVTNKHHKLIHLWLDQLCRDGVLIHKDGEFRYSGSFPDEPDSTLPQQAWCQRLSRYLDENIQAHSALLNGSQSALELLFKDKTITDSLYRTNPSLRLLNQSAAQAISAIAKMQAQGLRVLEIGAGTAATTCEVLNLASPMIHDYQFTDVSHAFLNEAREMLVAYPQVSYGLLDINQSVSEKFHIEGGYHVILAVNVLHDAVDLPCSLQRLRSLLAEDGYLIFIEATDQYSPMQLATVGFIEGINAFSDFRQQAQSGMLTQPAWLALLEEQGFVPQFTYPTDSVSVLRQHLIIAQNSSQSLEPAAFRPNTEQEKPQPSVASALTMHPQGNSELFNQVTELWASILKRPVQANSDFFHSGGDSLMATKMVVALHQQSVINATLQLIFEYPVLQDFVARLDNFKEDCVPNPEPQPSHWQQEIIRDTWQSLLNTEIQNQTDFFHSGGDSLMATKMVVALQQAGVKQASLQLIFEHSQFAEFCAALYDAEPETIEEDQVKTEKVPSCEVRGHQYPLTPLQNAYWLGENALFSLGNGIAHFYAELEIQHLERHRLTQAWNTLVQFHDQLRGEIQAGQYCIHPTVPEYQPQFTDLSTMDEQQKKCWLHTARERIANQGVSTHQWPLFDIHLVQIDSNTSLVHLVIDLVVADGKSLNTLFQQWLALYNDPTTKLTKPAMATDTYFHELAKLKDLEQYQQAKTYWLQRVPTLPDAPALPLSEVRSEVLSQSVLTHHLNADLWTKIQQASFAHNLLPSMTMLSTFCLVLSKWSENKHFSINVLHGNRQAMQPESESIIGNLSTTSMLEVNATQIGSFLSFVEQIQQQMASDLANAHFDGQQVLTEKNRHNHNFSTGMPVVFNDTVSVGQSRPLQQGKLNEFGAQTPHVYLDAMLISSPCGGIQIKWTIQESHLKSGIFDAMFATYISALETIPALLWTNPLALPLVAPQQYIREQVNDTPLEGQDASSVSTLCDLVRLGVEQYPQQIAIQQGDLELTYQELWSSAQNLATEILKQQDDSPLIAIVMDKSWQQILASIGILLAGKAYMPVDATYPAQRIQALLQQGGVNTVIAQTSDLEILPHYRIIVPELSNDTIGDFTPVPIRATDLAYVIFTSGSTGQPKGVMMEHAAVVNTLLDLNQRIALNRHDRVLAISALNFDLSVFDIFSTLSRGARIVIPSISSSQDPEALVRLAQQSGITIWNSVPAFAQLLADLLELNSSPLQSLRHIMMSGDWIPVNLPDRLTKVAPNAQLLSLGGATEAAIWSICHPIEKSYADQTSIPYGKPLSNQHFYILDQQLEPCPDWVTGELYIGGHGLARGYWQDQERTDHAFIIHPMSGERLYKTGDLGRYLPDGNIEFLGRNDHQVKINGYRIELGEVENALRQCPYCSTGIQVQDAIVQADKHSKNGMRLIAYVQYAPHSQVDNQALLEYMRKVLPHYLCPAQIIAVDHFPLTPNGKVDRSALPHPETNVADEMVRIPSSQHEQALAKIWAECLNLEVIPANQSFFDLGGNSLIAVRLLNQINRRLDASLNAGELQTHDTIERLATLLASQSQNEPKMPVKLTSNSDNQNYTLFIVHPIGGHLLSYQTLASELDNITLYGLAYQEHHASPDKATDIHTLAQHYLAMVRRVQPNGPYHLAGWSFGGVVAFEMAQQLIQQGETVQQCVLIDSYKPSKNPTHPLTDEAIRQHFYADCMGRFPKLTHCETPSFQSDAEFCSQLAIAFSSMDSGPLDCSTLAHLLKVYQQNLRSMLNYQPSHLGEFPVTLYAAQSNQHLDFMSYQHPDIAQRACHGWSDYCSPTIQLMPGDHYTLLQQPNVKTLARALSDLLMKNIHSLHSLHKQNAEELTNE